MFEFVLGFLLSWPFLAICIILAIISEYNDSSWTAFFTIVVAVVCFFLFDIALKDFLIGIPVYIVVGIIWSFWRYRRHVIKAIEREKLADGRLDARYVEALKSRLSPTSMLSTIVFWIVVWPFSFVENLLDDVITGLKLLVTTVFKSIYRRIYESAFADLQIKPNDKE